VTSEYVALTMAEMMRGVTSGGGTAPAASAVGHPVAGKTGTVNDHTDVWFIGYTPTYVTGVWMGYPERKRSLGSGFTGGRGALPIWIEFMKDFLKDKPKEQFEKAPKMPEDIRELYLQRQREMAEEKQAFMASVSKEGAREASAAPAEPKLEQITLPPAAGQGLNATAPPSGGGDSERSEPAAPRVVPRIEETAPPPPPATRPREVDPPKKKGKKGTDEPDN
jgi:penicillin-binding protein 1A